MKFFSKIFVTMIVLIGFGCVTHGDKNSNIFDFPNQQPMKFNVSLKPIDNVTVYSSLVQQELKAGHEYNLKIKFKDNLNTDDKNTKLAAVMTLATGITIMNGELTNSPNQQILWKGITDSEPYFPVGEDTTITASFKVPTEYNGVTPCLVIMVAYGVSEKLDDGVTSWYITSDKVNLTFKELQLEDLENSHKIRFSNSFGDSIQD